MMVVYGGGVRRNERRDKYKWVEEEKVVFRANIY
jgi:hypothetical protein